jgi:alpha,alpha-trehalase
MKLPVVIDPRCYDAVLFDLDGVVTDTASIHAKAWATMFDDFLTVRRPHEGENHSPFTNDDYRRFVDGKSRHDGVADFLASRGISLDHGSPADDAMAETVWGAGQPETGTVPAVARRRCTGLRLDRRAGAAIEPRRLATAVYTASRNCERVLTAAGIEDLFRVRVDGIVAAELGLPGKPDPAVLLETARRLQVPPDRCVVIEDAEAGVAAGRNGGFSFVIGIDRTGHRAALVEQRTDAVVTDLADVAVRD